MINSNAPFTITDAIEPEAIVVVVTKKNGISGIIERRRSRKHNCEAAPRLVLLNGRELEFERHHEFLHRPRIR
ncbi:hypothetical protein E6H32_06195 [Candidatus Bathyarchaeota archaeon]|nr:MAG: hypothetical protein E6H32_06195 [Candidatus Bathyarchaeota archaeon]